MPWQDQSRHFNTDPNAQSGTAGDARIQHAEEHLARAVELQEKAAQLSQGGFISRMRASSAAKKALVELGTGLHSLQDVSAHADEFVTPRTTLGVTYLQHLDRMEADEPGRPNAPNVRFLNTRDATASYLGQFIGATRSGPPK